MLELSCADYAPNSPHQQFLWRQGRRRTFLLFLLMLSTAISPAQDIEPRRWSHLPLGSSFAGAAYAYTEGDIFLNPVLQIEDGEFELHSFGVKLIHAFEFMGKSARVDVGQVYQSGEWSGLHSGIPATVSREGWSDTSLRLSMNLLGAPPLAGKDFAAYRATTKNETILGLGLLLNFPTGKYYPDKLINLGTNRYMVAPQIGIVRDQGNWTMELSGAVQFYTDNDEFLGTKRLEEAPLFIGQGHLIYTFRPGLWLAGSIGYGYGGESTIDGVAADDRKGNLGWGLSLGIPVTKNFGFKFAYIGIKTDQDTGSDNNTFTMACSLMW